jgi:hypothetical protein
MNAGRWLTPPRAIAALVTESGYHRFRAELYHFGEEPRPMEAELYLLEPGEYDLRLSEEGSESTAYETNLTVEGPRTRVKFNLPPRQLCVLEVKRKLRSQ